MFEAVDEGVIDISAAYSFMELIFINSPQRAAEFTICYLSSYLTFLNIVFYILIFGC